MTTTTTEARYELMVVLKADRRDEEITKHIDSIKKHVEDHGGKFFHEDDWGKRDLAYKIKGEEMGYYIVYGVEIEPVHIKELNDILRIDQSLLRYLLNKMPKGYELMNISEEDLDFSKKRKEEKEEEKEEEKPVKKEEPKEEAEAEAEAPQEEEETTEEEVVEEQEETTEEAPAEEEKEEEAPAEEPEEEVEEEKPEEVEEEEEPAKEEEEVVEEKEEEPAEEKPKKKKAEDETIDDLDKKLQAIMNDTDIDISL